MKNLILFFDRFLKNLKYIVCISGLMHLYSVWTLYNIVASMKRGISRERPFTTELIVGYFFALMTCVVGFMVVRAENKRKQSYKRTQ